MSKRGAERQITSDDKSDDETSDSPGLEQHKVSAEELSKRRILKVRPRSSKESTSSGAKEGEEDGESDCSKEKKAANPFASVSFATNSNKVVTIDTSHNGDVEDKKEGTTVVSKSASNTNLSISIPSPNSAAQGQSSIDKLPAHLKGYISPKPPSTPGSLTPGGQNRHNPFSSISPKTNPFVVGHDKNPIWAEVNKDKEKGGAEGAGDAGMAKEGNEKEETPIAAHSNGTTTAATSTNAPVGTETAAPPAANDSINPFANVKNPFAKNTISNSTTGLAFGKNAGKDASAPHSIFGAGKGLLSTMGSGSGGSVGVFGANKGISGGAPAFLSAQSNRSTSALSVFGTTSSTAATTAIPDGEKDGASTNDSVDLSRRESGASTASSQDGPEDTTTTNDGTEGNEGHDGHVMISNNKVYSMPGGPIMTGEEDECCMLQARVKLYKLRDKVREEVDEYALSHSNGTTGSTNTTDTTTSSSNNNNNKKKSVKSEGEVKEWTEMGVGPLKILRHKTIDEKGATALPPTLLPNELRHLGVRLVMRREAKKGGPGTTVILNVPLKEYCSICKQSDSDKALIFTTFILEEEKREKEKCTMTSTTGSASTSTMTTATDSADGNAKSMPVQMSYLFKCKTSTESDELLEVIQRMITAKK